MVAIGVGRLYEVALAAFGLFSVIFIFCGLGLV